MTFAAQGPDQALTQLNSLVTCTNDKWVLNNNECGSIAQWAATDPATKNNDATPICINVLTFFTAGRSHSFTASTRYTNTCVNASN